MSESDFGCVIIYLLPPNRNRLRLLQHTRRKLPRLQDTLLSHTVREHQLHSPPGSDPYHSPRRFALSPQTQAEDSGICTSSWACPCMVANSPFLFKSNIHIPTRDSTSYVAFSSTARLRARGRLYSPQREKFSTKGQCKVLILYVSSRTNCK